MIMEFGRSATSLVMSAQVAPHRMSKGPFGALCLEGLDFDLWETKAKHSQQARPKVMPLNPLHTLFSDQTMSTRIQ